MLELMFYDVGIGNAVAATPAATSSSDTVAGGCTATAAAARASS